MSNDAEHSTSLSPGELEQLVSDAWKTAARLNPMCLIKLNPDLAFEHLRGLISGCLAKGMKRSEVSAYVVQELLGSSGKSDAQDKHVA